MQRICLEKTVFLFNYPLQAIQALALLYQLLIFASENLSIVYWISHNVDLRVGRKLFMIDIDGNAAIDENLFYQQLSDLPRSFINSVRFDRVCDSIFGNSFSR